MQSIKVFVVNFHIFWYISTSLLFVVSLMLSLNGKFTCTFGLHFTFSLPGLSKMVEVEKNKCQNSQTFWRVDNSVSFLSQPFLSNQLLWSFSFNLSVKFSPLTALAIAETLAVSSKSEADLFLESPLEKRWTLPLCVKSGKCFSTWLMAFFDEVDLLEDNLLVSMLVFFLWK